MTTQRHSKSERAGRLAKGWELIENQAYSEAETLFSDLVRDVEAEFGAEAPELIGPLYGYAGTISKQSPWNVFPSKEREALERALRIACGTYGDESVQATRVRQVLAMKLPYAGEHELGIQHMEIVVRVKEPILGEGTLLAHNLNGLAGMYADFGRHAEAVSIYERAFSMAGDRGNDLMDFEIHSARGRSLVSLGRYTDAIPPLEKALAWYLGKYGERNRGTVELRDWLERAREGMKTEPPR